MLTRLVTPLMFKIGGGIIALLLLALGVQSYRLNSVRADLAEARANVGAANVMLRQCNAATDALRRQSERMRAEQEQALRAAREANERQGSAIESLRRSSVTPRTGPGCTISEELRRAEGL